MSNFNPIQIISRLTANAVKNYMTGAGNANAQAANGTAGVNSFNQAFGPNSNSANQGTIFTGLNYPVLSLASEMKLTTVEIEQKANYVKDLLNLPRDFFALLDGISSNTQSSSAQALNQKLSQLLVNGKINLSLLTAMLNGSSKEAIQKLLMVIANVSKYGANDVSSLKELMSLFNVNSAVLQDNQALKNLMLLYLPWLPLSVRNDNDLDFDIDIFDKIKGADPSEEEPVEVVKVLIETLNFQNISGTLQMNEVGQIDVYIAAVKDFPEKRALELLNADAKDANIKSNILIETKKPQMAEPDVALDNASSSSNNIQITSSNMVSPKLMLLAHSLIKIVIELDYYSSIIKQRKERSLSLDDNLDEGKLP